MVGLSQARIGLTDPGCSRTIYGLVVRRNCEQLRLSKASHEDTSGPRPCEATHAWDGAIHPNLGPEMSPGVSRREGVQNFSDQGHSQSLSGLISS